jgi:hypothetical protein
MSHYFAAVVVPPDTTRADAEERVRPLMAPWDENREVAQKTDEDGATYWHNPSGKWDWWQIGGRWTGVWSSYNPQTDPDNIETCRICGGTGMRMDHLGIQQRAIDPGYTCNGCSGKGMKVKWPTDWKAIDSDIIPVAYYLDTPGIRVPFAVVIPDGGWHEKETFIWDDEAKNGHFETIPEQEWVERVTKLLAPCRGARLVIVDYHD